MVVDAGGGTVDLSAYDRGSTGSGRFEEITSPQCMCLTAAIDQPLIFSHSLGLFKGSIFVTKNATRYIQSE